MVKLSSFSINDDFEIVFNAFSNENTQSLISNRVIIKSKELFRDWLIFQLQSYYHEFSVMKPRVLEFFDKLKEANIIPFFDCNAMPVCVWAEDERNRILQDFPEVKNKTNIFNTMVSCSPIIDILPGLTVIRCFGLSEHTKKKISDFKNIEEARNYYARTIDSFACNSCHSKECFSCYEREIGRCNGGCLCFKINDIGKINTYCNSLYK